MKKIVVSGASGLVGSALVASLQSTGHYVGRLRRARGEGAGVLGRVDDAGAIIWDPYSSLPPEALEGFEAVIHLAGENIASGRWTKDRKEKILQSRVRGTKTLVDAMLAVKNGPRTLVCASAIGYYGGRGDEILMETSASGEGFLAEVCRQWESATQPAAAAGMRVANLRFGVILSPKGGMLKTVLTPFRLGLGGRVGNGRQYMSWVALADVIAVIEEVLEKDSFSGPVNVVSPNPVTNAEFTATLAKVLSRPAILPVPAAAIRLLLGEMGDELLLASQRVEPARLLTSGFEHKFPTLEGALRMMLR